MFQSIDPKRARRPGGRSILGWLQVAIVTLAMPMSAMALPVDVFFLGLQPIAAPDTAFGIGITQAEDARDNFGIPILSDIEGLGPIDGLLAVQQPPPSEISFAPDPPTSSQNRATSTWQIENTSGGDLIGASYVLFTSNVPFTENDIFVDYADENVGLTIDADDGWVIILATDADSNEYYYPALLLDRNALDALEGIVADGASVPAQINYVVNEPLVKVATTIDGDVYSLPKLTLGFAQVVPEPGTALLLGLGLVGLAARRNTPARDAA